MANVDGKTVLIVDDDSETLIFLKLILEPQGYRVLLAGGVETALRVLRHDDLAVNLLLTNRFLPGASGAEIARWSRSLRPALPILFMSRFEDSEAVRLKVWDGAGLLFEGNNTEREFLRKISDFLGATPMPSHRPEKAFRATV